MSKHLFLPNKNTSAIKLHPEHEAWLIKWLDSIEPQIEDGNIASSMCLQAAIGECILHGGPKHDWVEILSSYLIDDSQAMPLAYSESFGKRLYKFESQWKQTPVHAIHTHFWLRRLLEENFNPKPFADLIENLIQPNGWIYNPEVSYTQIRTRMKSEYLMSFAMGLEILSFCDRLNNQRDEFTATLASLPLTPYISAEYFRIIALNILSAMEQKPTGLEDMVLNRKAGVGYCDFLASEKVDDYMGTAKRTDRDINVHSPLSSLQTLYLSEFMEEESKNQVRERIDGFKNHLIKNPLDIPAFQIRDLSIPFGTDVSPLEIIVASIIIDE